MKEANCFSSSLAEKNVIVVLSLKGRFVKNCHLTFSYWATVILWIYTSKFSGFSFYGFVVVVLKNVLKRAHARVPATLFWRETVTVCNVTGKVHQHGSSFVRNKTFPYIQIMDSIPLVFQVYLKFYVCLQSVSCEVCEAFFSINKKSPQGWTQQRNKVLYMFITLFNIQYTTVLPKKVPLFEYLSMKAACATSPTLSCTTTSSKSAWLYLTLLI